jgi:tetratricopeptide (TPR) repeat protein
MSEFLRVDQSHAYKRPFSSIGSSVLQPGADGSLRDSPYANPPPPVEADSAIEALDEFLRCDLGESLTHQVRGGSRRQDGEERAHERGNAAPPGYRILGVLGRGGMGVVFKAWQIALKRVVALKMVRFASHANPELLLRLRSEAEAAARLQHPHIVQVHEVGEWRGLPYFSMEFVNGGTLENAIKGGPMPYEQAAKMMECLATAVQAAHTSGIVHRDLKPANVRLSADGTAKIADFGLAKHLDAVQDANLRTHSGTIIGTPSYMAPEQASGLSSQIGRATDIYALGVILYEMLTGKTPFRAADPLLTLEAVRTQEPASPSTIQGGLPRDLVTICLKCLQKEPAKRYASAAELAEDLRRYRAGESIHARPVGAPERLLKWARRKPAHAGLVGFTLLATIGLVLGMAWHDLQMRGEVSRANDAHAEAENSKTQALARFRKGHETLDSMLNELETDALRVSDSASIALRKKQEEAALNYYHEALLSLDDPDPEIRFTKAMTHAYAANVQRLLQRMDEAVADYGRAIAMLDEVCKEQPENLQWRCQLAFCLYRQADARTLKSTADCDAEPGYLRALAIAKNVLDADPGCTKARRIQACCHRQLLVMHQANGESDRAKEFGTKSAADWTALLRDDPTNDDARMQLGEVLRRLACISIIEADWDRLEEFARREIAMMTPLLSSPRCDYATALGLSKLGEAHRHLGWILFDWRERRDGAIETLSAGLRIVDLVLEREPRLREARAVRQGLLDLRAICYARMNLYQEALKDRERAAKLADASFVPRAQLALASAYMDVGDRTHALEAARAAANATPAGDGPVARDLAGAFCRLAGDIHVDETLDPVERARLEETCALDAVACLRRSDLAGYFKGSDKRSELNSDSSFAPIRSRGDFQAFLSEITPQRSAPAKN